MVLFGMYFYVKFFNKKSFVHKNVCYLYSIFDKGTTYPTRQWCDNHSIVNSIFVSSFDNNESMSCMFDNGIFKIYGLYNSTFDCIIKKQFDKESIVSHFIDENKISLVAVTSSQAHSILLHNISCER